MKSAGEDLDKAYTQATEYFHGLKNEELPRSFIEPATLSSDLLFIVANAELSNFGILSSSFHNAWNRTVCGRLGNGYRYSAGIVYKKLNFRRNYPVSVKT